MALSDSEKQLLKQISQRLKDEPLKPGSELYQPIYDAPEVKDPVARLQVNIEGPESIQLFSGFRGAGKTTELFRLKKVLENEGAVVLYSDALEYLNPAEPVEVASLLIAIAGGFNDALESALGVDVAKESFWQRLQHYLTTASLAVTEANVGVEADSPAREVLGGLKGGVELKLALKEATSFRQKLAQFLDNRLPKLKEEMNQFLEAAVKAIRARRGKDTPIVFIFDQLEQIRGSISTANSVIQSVERIFAAHLNLLKLPYVHCIYTVPPWLRFVVPGAVGIEIIPTLKLWENNSRRTAYPPGRQAVRQLLVKRFTPEGFAKVFGGDPGSPNTLADELIAYCGGHFRDLQRLLRELIVQILTQSRALPVTKDVVERTIGEIRAQFLPISLEDAQWLARIEKHRAAVLPSVAPDHVSWLSRFLDTHFVLFFRSNSTEWYDIHPLIRDEVARLAQPASTARKSTKSGKR